MDNQTNKLIDSGLIITFATAFLYCVSTAQNGGYLGVLLLDTDILDRNLDQILYNGFVISFSLVTWVVMIYLGWRFVYSHMILPEFNDWYSFSIRRKVVKFKKKYCPKKRKDSPLETREKHKTRKAGFYFMLFIFFISSLVYFEKQGKKDAMELLRSIESKQIAQANLINVNIDDEIRHLHLLICGARNCAGIESETKRIYYFPQNGHSYRYEKLIMSSTDQNAKP
ncbi:hypothetical protein B0F87_10469 [Methylobacter tundripaludum]|uniref:Uncharacterized protein n=1 Tax=Methylobacter tundripaludum TaxID=173365 RepID=A0A2S6HEQ7_9GAMM|nr:hypothetical protein [Methylobacter tundripaludum]PPK75979.1 hypothetical protein B0F87_10469 [Methylobacter tundripaludum]